MTVGRKRKPTAIKAIEGKLTKRDRMRREPIPVGGVGTAPGYLPPEGKRLWELVTAAMPTAVYTAADRQLLETYCMQYALYRAAVAGFKRGGQRAVVETPNGSLQTNPLISQIRQASDMLRRIGAELGLSPTARARLEAPEGTPASDASWFAEHA